MHVKYNLGSQETMSLKRSEVIRTTEPTLIIAGLRSRICYTVRCTERRTGVTKVIVLDGLSLWKQTLS